MNDSFTIPQEHGKDSLVEVTQDIQDGYPEPTRILRFYTDQSLASNSGRAWNVHTAIEKYCTDRGYRIMDETQHEVTAVYNPQSHSHQALTSLRQDIRADARYEAALAEGKQMAQEIQDTYGPAIAQLENAVRALKARASAEFGNVAEYVGGIQHLVIADLEFPPHLLPSDQEALHRPHFRPDFDYYARYKTDLDRLDLSSIMALLR